MAHLEDIIVFWDPHERIDEVKELLGSFGVRFRGDRMVYIPNGKVFACTGNWLNKSNDTVRAISFVLANPEILSVRGNHERFVANYVRGLMDKFDSTKEILHKFPSAIPLRKMFENGTDSEKEFIKAFLEWESKLPAQRTFKSSKWDGRVFLTHAPVPREYYLSDSEEFDSCKVNFRVKDRDATEFRQICPVPYNAVNAMKKNEYAVFWHFQFEYPFDMNGYIGIDTGAAYGHRLSAVSFPNGVPIFTSVHSNGSGVYAYSPEFFVA